MYSEWLASKTTVPKMVYLNLGSLVEEYPLGLAVDQLLDAFKARFKYDLDYADYGYVSPTKLIDDLPGIFRRVKSKSGYEKVFAAKRPVSDWEKKFKELGDVLDVLPSDIQMNITKILEKHEEISMDEFIDAYADAYGCKIDPTEFGYWDMEELINMLEGKLLVIYEKNGLEKHHERNIDWNPGPICDLGILQKTMKRSEFPAGAVTPHDPINYRQWNQEIKPGETMKIVITSIKRLSIAPMMYMQLYHHIDVIDQLTKSMK